MSNITIIVDDNAVYVDGAALAGLNLSSCGIPTGVHALQWKANLGWIEFAETTDGSPKQPNEVINVLPDWANNCVTAFNNQVAANQAAKAEAAAKAAANQPKTTGTTVV
jgi:hypothetical protein